MRHETMRSGYAPSPRQVQIENCLLQNMQQIPYSSISISELCRQVGISRRAFYLYFKDKEDCLYSLIERKFQNLLLVTTRSVAEDASDLEACRTFLTIFREHRAVFDTMLQNRQIDNMIFRIVHHATHGGDCFLPTKKITTAQIDTDMISCLITSQVALMLRWYNNNYETPVEEMAEKLLKLTDIVLP